MVIPFLWALSSLAPSQMLRDVLCSGAPAGMIGWLGDPIRCLPLITINGMGNLLSQTLISIILFIANLGLS